jgi:hypothetical protein
MLYASEIRVPGVGTVRHTLAAPLITVPQHVLCGVFIRIHTYIYIYTAELGMKRPVGGINWTYYYYI